MGYFSQDGASTIDGSVDPVYVSLGEAGSLAAIYPTRAIGVLSCKFIGSPSENGTQIFDNKIFLPMKFTIQGVVKPEHFYIMKEVNDELYQRRVIKGTAYIRGGFFPNMMVESLEIISTNELYDGNEIRLVLCEFMESETEVKK